MTGFQISTMCYAFLFLGWCAVPCKVYLQKQKGQYSTLFVLWVVSVISILIAQLKFAYEFGPFSFTFLNVAGLLCGAATGVSYSVGSILFVFDQDFEDRGEHFKWETRFRIWLIVATFLLIFGGYFLGLQYVIDLEEQRGVKWSWWD